MIKLIAYIREPTAIKGTLKQTPKVIATLAKVARVESEELDPSLPDLVKFWLKTGE